MSPSFEGLGALREGFSEGAELSQAFFNVTIWTMPHIFLEGKAMVSQKIMGAFYRCASKGSEGAGQYLGGWV